MPLSLDVNEIQQVLPHRYPFLLVDSILELEPQKRIVGLKNVTITEPWFAGHFPGYPIMPGVLIVEAMAQTGGVLLLRDVPDRDRKLVLFTAIEEAKFRHPVLPGDQLRMELDVLALRNTVCKMRARATVRGRLVAEAVIMCIIADREAVQKPASRP